MSRNTPVSAVMTSEVLTFSPEMRVADAARSLLDRGVDGAPVVDGDDQVVGVLGADDLIVQESRLHLPTVIDLLGGYIELPSSQRHFEEDLRKALGSRVDDVMDDEPVCIRPDAPLEDAATLMHERGLSRLPVTDEDGRLVGIVSRGDILRSIVRSAEAEGRA